MQELQNSREWLPSPIEEFKSIQKPSTYQDLITCHSPTLALFSRRYGRQGTEAVLILVLKSVSDGLGMAATAEMMADVADEILQQFPDVKLSDLLLFKKEVLAGRVGGQVGDQLWKWTTRNMNLAFAEYYTNRQNVIWDHRDQIYAQEKAEYASGLARAFAKASPEIQEQHRKNVAMLEAKQKAAFDLSEEKKAIIPQKLTLEEIAAHEGIDMEVLADKIRHGAEMRQLAANTTTPLTLFVSAEMASVLFEARQNPKFLHEYIN